METEVDTLQTAIPATNYTGISLLFDWKKNIDYEILEQMESDNIEIDVDKKNDSKSN